MPSTGKDGTDQVPDYSSFAAAFKLEDVTGLLSGDLENGLNVCVECCDRWAETDSIALNWEGADGTSSSHSFAELQEGAARFANLLTAQGVRPGDHVACMLPRIPDLFVVALGVWRAGAVYVPLFTAFGPKAIEYRLERSAASLVVTDKPIGESSSSDTANTAMIAITSSAGTVAPDMPANGTKHRNARPMPMTP